MIIKPKVRGFICTTAHPSGCEANVLEQIAYTQSLGTLEHGPKRVLIIGSSSGYGLASRITAAFACKAATIGVFFEKPAKEKKPGTAGWYNAAVFDRLAHKSGVYAKSLNGDAFSHAAKEKTIDLIKTDLGQVDMVIYSLASPVRKLPDSNEIIRSVLKPIGQTYTATAVDTNKDKLFEACVEPANEEEVAATVKVMGGEDWELWIDALSAAGVLADGCKTVAYSYIGTEITWPIYWHGALGAAKKDLDRSAKLLNQKLSKINGSANIAVLKSVVTQASSAIPVMPLYLAMVFKKMREEGVHEGCIEQITRMFWQHLYAKDRKHAKIDEENRIRMDDWELREDIQSHCQTLWSQLTDDNLSQLTDYQLYKDEFLKLFGFGIESVNYDAEVNPLVEFDVIAI